MQRTCKRRRERGSHSVHIYALILHRYRTGITRIARLSARTGINLRSTIFIISISCICGVCVSIPSVIVVVIVIRTRVIVALIEVVR